MSKKTKIPDAWDDDWEAIADKADFASVAKEEEEEKEKISKKERLARHAETNKKLWESAEEPETFHFLAASESKVPLRTEFKPQLKVLARKPAPKIIQRVDPVTGLAKMSLEDDDDDEDAKDQPTAEELRLKAQKEREEKQKRYDEARARILGTGSGTSSPGATTPPRSRGQGRGQRPGSQNGGTKELFDPNFTAKPGAFSIQKRNGEGPSRSGASTPKNEDFVIRAPRGPDANGKGFAKKGGKN